MKCSKFFERYYPNFEKVFRNISQTKFHALKVFFSLRLEKITNTQTSDKYLSLVDRLMLMCAGQTSPVLALPFCRLCLTVSIAAGTRLLSFLAPDRLQCRMPASLRTKNATLRDDVSSSYQVCIHNVFHPKQKRTLYSASLSNDFSTNSFSKACASSIWKQRVNVVVVDVSQPDTGHFTVACKRVVKFIPSQEFTYFLDDFVRYSAMRHAAVAALEGDITERTEPSAVVELFRFEIGNAFASVRGLLVGGHSRPFVVVIHQSSTKNKKREKCEISQSKENRANQRKSRQSKDT
jgi:hypothetical protein